MIERHPSAGTISSVIKQHQQSKKQSQSDKKTSGEVKKNPVGEPTDNSLLQKQEANDSKYTDENVMTSPPSFASLGDGQSVIVSDMTVKNQVETPQTLEEPVSSDQDQDRVKKNKDISITNTQGSFSVLGQDFKENGYPHENGKEGGPLSWFTPHMTNGMTSQIVFDQSAVNNISEKVINASSEPTNLKDIDFDDISYPDFYPTGLDEELRKVLEAEKLEIESSRMVLDADKKAFEEETEVIRSHMRQKVSSEKYLIKHESLVLERKRKELDERMRQLEQKERDLVIRETIVSEAELLLPIVRRLQTTGLEFDAILPWIETVTEVAKMQGTDSKTTAQYIAYELLTFYKLGGLQKELESTQAQLEMLKTATEQRERGLNMIAELENKGVSLDVIYELSKVLDLEKIAKELSIRITPLPTQGIVGQNGYTNGYNPSVNKDPNHVNGNSNMDTSVNNGHKSSNVVDIEKSNNSKHGSEVPKN